MIWEGGREFKPRRNDSPSAFLSDRVYDTIVAVTGSFRTSNRPMAKRKPNSTAEFRTQIREAGLRSTMARATVLERMSRATSPVSHAELAAELAPVGFDKATIYRNLVEMAEAGLLSRVDLGDHVWRFEMKREDDDHPSEHPHFVCVDCGEVSCLPGVTVNVANQAGAKNKKSIIGDVTQVLLKGHCDRCV
jgi:Fur family transcriptional regulator, ferric uptake regulator